MRILLIYPVPPPRAWPRGLFRSRWVPTGIAQIAAELRHAGHEVRILVREEQLMKAGLDWSAADGALRQLLSEFRPAMVGLSVVTPGMPEAGAIAALTKGLLGRDVLVVAGGPHPSALPAETLAECPDVDVVAVGDGEAATVALAERGPADDLAGIVFRRDGQYVHTPPRAPPADLDSFQPIPYDLFDMAHYAARDRWMIRWLKLAATNIRTSRGCPNRCRFCAGHVVSGLGVRFHSVQYVLQHIQDVVDRFGVEAVRFEDETLGADRGRLLALCEGIRRLDLHPKICWSGCLRVNQAEPELLAEMKSAGCIQIEYGFETGSDRMLGRLAKNTKVDQNRRAVRLTRAAGIRIFADVMVGLPGETEADFRDTVRFVRWAKPDIISASRLYPLPGTAIYDELPADRRRQLQWGDYAYLNNPPHGLGLADMTDDRLDELYGRFRKYVVRPMLTRHLLRDTPAGDADVRRSLRRKIRRFTLRHPIHAARLLL